MASITIHTGVPGAGKTLNAIKELFEDSQFKNRPVFYFGLKGCTLENWTELTHEQLQNWWCEVPESSVILVDEAQDVWRARPQGSRVPESVQQMEKTRHLGISFFLTCQFPTQLDTGVRALCGLHRHYERLFNSSFLKVYEYSKCKSSPDSRSEKKDAVIKNIRLDKKYYGFYKSANIHLEKSRVPLFVWILLIMAAIIVPLVMVAIRVIDDREESTVPTTVPSSQYVSASMPENYGDKFKSRLIGHPFSASFYDELVEPTQYPKVAGCMEFTECLCNTQQGTIISDMPQAVCKRYVSEGVFDFSPSDEEELSEFLPTGEPCCAGDINTKS